MWMYLIKINLIIIVHSLWNYIGPEIIMILKLTIQSQLLWIRKQTFSRMYGYLLLNYNKIRKLILSKTYLAKKCSSFFICCFH